MPEHQQIQQSKKTNTIFQKQATPISQTPVSNPYSIIQRAKINPKSLTHADIMQLQRTIGNQAVGRLLSSIGNTSTARQETVQRQEIPEEEEPLQGKFENSPGQVTCPLCFASSIVQKQESEEEEKPLQGKMIGTIQRQEIPYEEELLQTKIENNTGMPDNLKAGVESLSGIDMSDVRVHYNSSKPAEVGALAYTKGTNIHVAPGQERHLPHEAWHVVQQVQGRVKPTMQMKDGVAVNDDEGLEHEADVMGEKTVHTRRPDSSVAGTAARPQMPVQRQLIQLRALDYQRLWRVDTGLAKLSITQTTGLEQYLKEAKDFEQKLGAGLFSNHLAHEGANKLIDAIAALLGDNANTVFGSAAYAREAGAIPSEKVQEARANGNLREKMYMVYTAIRSGAVAKKMTADQGLVVPKIKDPHTGKQVEDIAALNTRHLARRGSTANQERLPNWSNLTANDRMTEDQLKEMGAPLSVREQALAGGKAPMFFPGKKGYLIEPGKKLTDTSLPSANNKKSYAEYQQERLVPLAAGLSGSTDWYFNLANQLQLDLDAKKKLRLAALGQMLVNGDHSFHEIMHEARTQGKLNDYPDELPIGYTTLNPLSEGEILQIAKVLEYPGDHEAENFNKANAKDQEPMGLAAVYGLPTAAGLKYLAGDPSHRFKIFGGKKYLAILSALDEYNIEISYEKKKNLLLTVSTKCEEWLNSHKNPSPTSLQAHRTVVLQWLKAKADAMHDDKKGPEAPPWIDAQYYDNAKTESYIIDAITAEIGAEVGPDISEVDRERLFRKALAKVKELTARQDLPGLLAMQKNLSREVDGSDSPLDASFVATTDDLSLDMNIRIEKKDLPIMIELMGRDWLEQVQKNVIDNVKIIREARRRRGAHDNSDLDAAPQEAPSLFFSAMPEKMRRTVEAKARQEVVLDVDRSYSSHIEDFQRNIDTSFLANVRPGTPVGDFLRRLKGEPLPPELAAIAAYAEPGFYQNMNYVLNNWNNRAFLATVPKELLQLCRLASSGLRKMKPYTGGSVYRGEPGLYEEEVNEAIKKRQAQRQLDWKKKFSGKRTYNQFVSTSKRLESSYAVKKGNFLAIEIQAVKSGVDISALSNSLYEREVLFPPRAPFTITSVTDKFVTKNKDGKVIPSTEQNKLTIPYEGKSEPGRIYVIMREG